MIQKKRFWKEQNLAESYRGEKIEKGMTDDGGGDNV